MAGIRERKSSFRDSGKRPGWAKGLPSVSRRKVRERWEHLCNGLPFFLLRPQLSHLSLMCTRCTIPLLAGLFLFQEEQREGKTLLWMVLMVWYFAFLNLSSTQPWQKAFRLCFFNILCFPSHVHTAPADMVLVSLAYLWIWLLVWNACESPASREVNSVSDCSQKHQRTSTSKESVLFLRQSGKLWGTVCPLVRQSSEKCL